MDKIVEGLDFSLRSNYVFVRPRYIKQGNSKNKIHQNSLFNLENNKNKGKLSSKAKQKLNNACNWLIYSSLPKSGFSRQQKNKFVYKISFITLTIPPQPNVQVTNSGLKKIMNSWLTYMKVYHKLNNYVWKMETHKDGRLHIHILTDTYLWHILIRKSWNRLLLKNGLLEWHMKKFGNYNPNSTDVHAVKKARNITAYIAKYMSKDNEEDERFSGRIWGCSTKLSNVGKSKMFLELDNIKEVMKALHKPNIEWQVCGDYDKFGNLVKKFGEIYFLKLQDWLNMKGNYLYHYFETIINYLRPKTLFNNLYN